MRRLKTRFAFALALGLLSPPWARAESNARLRLVLVDPLGVADFAFKAVRDEVRAQLRPVGFEVSADATNTDSYAPSREIGVIFVRGPRPAHLTPGVMGSVRIGDRQAWAVWIYTDSVVETVGLDPGHRDRWTKIHEWVVGKALGRVVAHELVHALMPDQPHAHEGLMASRLGPEELLLRDVGFDERTASALRQASLRDPGPH